jgi:hypothetical protein
MPAQVTPAASITPTPVSSTTATSP